MTFDPAKINLQQSQHQCERGGRVSVCVTTEMCFMYRIKSDQPDPNTNTGEPCSILPWSQSFYQWNDSPIIHFSASSLSRLSCDAVTGWPCTFLLCPAEIQYTLTLDALRAKARASFFSSDDKSDRRITGRVTVTDRAKKPSCVNEIFMMSASTLIFIMSAWGHLWFLTCKESTPKH